MDVSDEKLKQLIGKLLKYMMKRLDLKSPPAHLILKHDDKNARKDWGWTGDYNPSTKTISLWTAKRHHIDILRSFAHEVIHHWQNERGQLKEPADPTSQYTQKNPHLRKMEMEAYLLGNIIFRDFEDIERFGNTDIVKV